MNRTSNPEIPDENYHNLIVALIKNGLQENGYFWLKTHQAEIWCGVIGIDREFLTRKCKELGVPPQMRIISLQNGKFRKFVPLDEYGQEIDDINSTWSRILREPDDEDLYGV